MFMTGYKKPGLWFPLIMLAGLLFLVYMRLVPFQVVWDGRLPLERVTWKALTIFDIPINILFILPFGFGLAGTLARFGWSTRAVGRGTILIGLLISLIFESIQIVMPEREPSLADLLANFFGLVAGYGLYRAWDFGWARSIETYVTTRNLIIGLAIYGVGVASLTAYLHWTTGFSNWDTGFPLVVGNEAAGFREWIGEVDQLAFLDRALDDDAARATLAGAPPVEWLADYALRGDEPYQDTRGALPPLWWQSGPRSPQPATGVAVGLGQWLATTGPVAALTSRVQATDELTIGLTIRSARQVQSGPARIVTVSADALRRNLTLGQQGEALVIRLRTPATGENANRPEIQAAGVFNDSRRQPILLVYKRPQVRLYLEGDSEPLSLSLAPGIAFFSDIRTQDTWIVDLAGNPYRYDIAYWSTMVGLAAIAAGVLGFARWAVVRRQSRETRVSL